MARGSGGLRRFATGDGGTAIIEFAIIAPIFLLIFAGMIDLGSVLFAKFLVSGAVSAGANLAIVEAGKVSSTDGGSLASDIAAIVGAKATTYTVVVNNGPTVTDGGAPSADPSGNADQCYCPTGAPPSWTWGSAATCGSTCASGAFAGKFVTITAGRSISPLFASYGLVHDGSVTANAVVQVQ